MSIKVSGWFGGLFSSVNRSTAESHGTMVYVIDSPRPLTDFELNYSIPGAWDKAVEICRSDENKADRIMQAGAPAADEFDPTDGWELQRLRGRLAAELGFTSVEMEDEHGTTWLCLPGCDIRPATDEDQ